MNAVRVLIYPFFEPKLLQNFPAVLSTDVRAHEANVVEQTALDQHRGLACITHFGLKFTAVKMCNRKLVDRQLAVIAFQLLGQQFEQGGFSRASCTDDSKPVSRVQLQVHGAQYEVKRLSSFAVTARFQNAYKFKGHGVDAFKSSALLSGLGLLPQKPVHFPQLTDRFRYHYLAKDHELHLFSGIRELLEDLRADGYLLGVATGKSRVGLDRSLGFHNLGHLFDETRTADESFSKPHPGMLLELSDATQVPVRRMLMIGDTTHDLEMASNAGVDAVAVTYGAHPPDTLKSAQSLAHVDDVQQLAQWLNDNLIIKPA